MDRKNDPGAGEPTHYVVTRTHPSPPQSACGATNRQSARIGCCVAGSGLPHNRGACNDHVGTSPGLLNAPSRRRATGSRPIPTGRGRPSGAALPTAKHYHYRMLRRRRRVLDLFPEPLCKPCNQPEPQLRTARLCPSSATAASIMSKLLPPPPSPGIWLVAIALPHTRLSPQNS
jgi:hypothetical protein